jgi:predicted outer membrane repeat protein
VALPIALFGFIALLFLLPFSGEVSRPLQAAPYPAPLAIAVENLDDAGPGSLRQAIDDIASGGTITFDVTGTITLTTGQLFVDKDLTIDGPGAALLAVSGNNAQRVLHVASGAVVTVEGVTIRNGFDTGDGAGINVDQSTLTLINAVVAHNVTLHGGGGLAGNDATITLAGSTFHDNSADGSGGAIKGILGTLSSINTTFSGNVALLEGGALALFSTDAASSTTRSRATLPRASPRSTSRW